MSAFFLLFMLLCYLMSLGSPAPTVYPSFSPTYSPTFDYAALTETNCSVYVKGLPSSELFINHNLTNIKNTTLISSGKIANIEFRYYWENVSTCFNCPVTLYSGVEGGNSSCVNEFTNNQIVNSFVDVKYSIVVKAGCQLIYATSIVGSSTCQNPKGGIIVGSIYGTSPPPYSFRLPKIIIWYAGMVLIIITVLGCLIACLFNTGQWIKELAANKYN